MNVYKTLDWQPELRPEKIKIPPYPDLQFEPGTKSNAWELVTAMGIGIDVRKVTVHNTPGGLLISTHTFWS